MANGKTNYSMYKVAGVMSGNPDQIIIDVYEGGFENGKKISVSTLILSKLKEICSKETTLEDRLQLERLINESEEVIKNNIILPKYKETS